MMALSEVASLYSQQSATLLTMLLEMYNAMYNVKIISLEASFTYEFDGMLSVSCMSYIISLTFGQS